MTADEIEKLLQQDFPQVVDNVEIESLGNLCGRVRLKVNEKNLRPGGTISGSTMFMLADVSIYILILAAIGPKRLAVTTNCCIDFMRKPELIDLIADARLLKLGQRLAFGDVLIYAEGLDQPVTHAGITYSLPSSSKPLVS